MKTAVPEPTAKNKNVKTGLLDENARLRGDLLTVAHRISHDLRTPLGGISMTGEMLKEMAAEGSPISGTLFNPIFDSTEELLRLIERVSFVLKASIKSVVKERVQMGDIVFETLEKLERKIIKNKATVSKPTNWPEVDGVRAWLRVIWHDLLSNSLQHAAHPLKIELGWKEEANGFRFWVSDDAGGVPADRREKLFQPFETLSEPDAANGLGLSIVERLVSLQGGQCGYEPHSHDGSLFYFTLSASDE
jgi:K+-sensing histidine kinase KdpD